MKEYCRADGTAEESGAREEQELELGVCSGRREAAGGPFRGPISPTSRAHTHATVEWFICHECHGMLGKPPCAVKPQPGRQLVVGVPA